MESARIDALIALASAIGTWAAVICALVVVSRQNSTSRRLMRLQLSIQIAAQYDSESMQWTRARLAERLLGAPDTLEINDALLIFLENVAHLSRRKLLDTGYMWNVFGIDVPYYWAALRHYVLHVRQELGDLTLYEELEDLSAAMQQVRRSPMGRPMPPLRINQPTIAAFLRMESKRAPNA